MDPAQADPVGSIPKEITEPLYTAVGHLAVNWAFVEQVLDMWCTLAYQTPGGGRIARELPRDTSRKIPIPQAMLP